MLYRDLVQFDPIETIVQLHDANKAPLAHKLVKSYVISNEMAKRIIEVIIPQIQFHKPMDNKGLLIVGNYGTGKSHLMSVISSVAGDKSLVNELNHPDVQEAVMQIAGQFKVIRREIGSTEMSLRNIIVSTLEDNLNQLNVEYTFPDANTIPSHKSAFEDMMAAYTEQYPDSGLLLVVDELLDYLKSRNDQQLIADLSFLREIGEICKDLRFRFIAGVQEAIFDSPRFHFVADSLRRVQARFEQVHIARSDIKFVVAERLLKKTAEQQVLIRDYLTPFAKCYGNMTERMEEFVRLFPIHPDYIDTFGDIAIVEKREVLKSFSYSMHGKLDQEVPAEYPGLIAFDSYWPQIIENRAFATLPEVSEVIKCSNVLVSRVETAITRKAYKPMALRIIHALSVHRLTVGDIYSALGASAAELRDRLCLYDALMLEGSDEPDSDLETYIETVLREIHKTVSGQFITRNESNGQYYLDLKKVDDFDALIEKRAESIDATQQDRYFYETLKRVMACTDITHATGYKIWQHQIMWHECQSTRLGYLFFGTPNERSTAVPTRDFYLYFLQPYGPTHFKDSKNNDELFFRFKPSNCEDAEVFTTTLQKYAAATDLASTASGQAKSTYIAKADEYLRKLAIWLQKNIQISFEVTYQGRKKSVAEWMKDTTVREIVAQAGRNSASFGDIINAVSSACLANYFKEQAPDYPRFSIKITEGNRIQAAQEALRAIAGAKRTHQATAVLDALQLLDSNETPATNSASYGENPLNPRQSPYAQFVLKALAAKGHGQVVNHTELLHSSLGNEYMDPQGARLEPEWLVLILAALVYSGDIVLSIVGKKFDATGLAEFVKTPMDDLKNFRHIEAPKDWNIPVLTELFTILSPFGTTPGMANLVTQGKDEPVQSLHQAMTTVINRLVRMQQVVHDGLTFWNFSVFTPELQQQHKDTLRLTKNFFESLQGYNTAGKLKNLNCTTEDIQKQKQGLHYLSELETIQMFIKDNQSTIVWLSHAEKAVPDYPNTVWYSWVNTIFEVRNTIRELIERSACNELLLRAHEFATSLQKLKKEYTTIYMEEHSKMRLGLNDDRRKSALLSDSRLGVLNSLATIGILNSNELMRYIEKLTRIKTCFSLCEEDLHDQCLCPHCSFTPSRESGQSVGAHTLTSLDNELDSIRTNWIKTLLANLQDPMTKANMVLLKEDERQAVEAFMMTKDLPDNIPHDFLSALNQLFSGLIKVTIKSYDLEYALQAHEGPATPEEMLKRFERYLADLTRGQDPSKIRIIME